MPNKAQDLIGANEAARLAHLDIRSIHRKVERGELKPVAKLPGVTGAFLFNRADILALTTPVDSTSPQVASAGVSSVSGGA